MSLRVITAGSASLLADAGRPASRALGVAVGGPADRASHALGNALVGNPPDACGLEIALVGPTLRAERDVGLCVFGAPFALAVDGRPVEPNRSFTLNAGRTLRIGTAAVGMRAYVCVPGGFAAPVVLGSRSAFEPIKAADSLACAESRLPGRWLADPPVLAESPVTLRCLPGTQADWFDPTDVAGPTFAVTAASNRMGWRLTGPPLRRPSREMVSEAVAPGAVQVANDGLPIVLGPDGQTIGGYPKAAHVIDADLDRLGQLRPGDEVRFAFVAADAAEAIGREYRAGLRACANWVRCAAGGR